MNEDETRELIQDLREATRAAHEMLKDSREERRKLENLKNEIRTICMEAAKGSIEIQIEEKAKMLMDFQKVMEDGLGKRFDDLIGGPLADLEDLIRNLHKVHKEIPISRMGPLPENPLFKM